ncbi:hypothetical protein H310_10992 [Aphanomyces invadans]|uniref:Uncharacterized protein n=1 Tax=Aphanomyces invadans TaxID=157072 RepID=A0A024TNF5_9STRA|nr:hypothetical protein H310_10992 [Aphanomyces invadans]ETV95548.1 hypothetical protein H310_10992 [Aphanomyces invadans]|eukprot:XP_008875741.1 hypothetical protein H310_10992 [Aphanomyces invadans]
MVYDLSSGGMQLCGCAVGRPCTCGYSVRRVAEESVVAVPDDDKWIEVAPGVVLRLRKEYENVPGTRNFRRMHQYRMSLADAIAEYSAAIAAANAHKKVVSLELVEVASRRKRLDEGRFPPSAGGKALSKKELQDVQQMMSAYSDLTTHLNGRPPGFVASTIPVAVHVLGPHLDLLHAQLSATIQNAKANIQGCKAFVYAMAATRIQAIARGRQLRILHARTLVTMWFRGEFAAAVTLQCFTRRNRARQYVAERRRRRHQCVCKIASIHVQRTVRGFLGRRAAAAKRLSLRQVKEAKAVVTLLCWVRCLAAFRQAKVQKDLRDADRRRIRRQEAAVDVQRVFRGHCGRVKARQRKIESNLSEPVRQLVSELQTTGDLWAFVQAVDNEYRHFDRERRDEEENASTFVNTVLRERMLHQERSLLAWHASRAMASPVVAHQRRLDSAYESPLPSVTSSASVSSPHGTISNSSGSMNSGGVVAPHSLFEMASEDAIHLHQIAPETIDLPDKYPPHVIRHAMAQGYAVEEVVAALRGLEAQGKTTRNVKLVLRELKRRTPLMLNALKSERVVRQSRQKSPPKHVPPPSVVLDSAALSHPPSSDGLAVVDDKMVATFLAQMLPDGVNEPMGKVIFAAAMLAFVPPLVDVDGASSVVLADPWTSSPNSHFAAYVKAPSALLQIRREQLVTAAIAPYEQVLKKNEIVHGGDLDRYANTLRQLQTWNVPGGLAQCIVLVLKNCRRRQHHIDSRHVRRQQSAATVPPSRVKSAARAIASPMTMRSSTADTILYDLTSRGATPASSPDDDPPSHGMSEIQCQFLDMKARIEATALTPVEMDSSLFDLFFQALFVVLPLDEATTQTPTSEAMNPCHLDSFVYQLLDPALTMHASHRLLKRRSQRTATMARAYSNAFKAANCHCVKDIVHRSLDAFHVPDVLAEQVRACIGKVLFPVSRYTIQHYRLPGHTRRTGHS